MAVKVTVYGTADMKQIAAARKELDKLQAAAVGSAGGFAGSMAKLSASATSAGDKMIAAGGAMTRGLTLPLVAVGYGLNKATQAAAEDAQQQVMLAEAMKNTAGATESQIKATENWITAQGKALGVTDTQLRPALATLTTATGDVARAQELAGLAMDIAAAKGIPVETAANALAKAYDGNATSLKRMIPGLDAGVLKSKDFAAIQAEVASVVGGQAAAAADTEAGARQRANVAMDEAIENLGTAFLPIMTQVTGFITSTVIPAITKFADWFNKLDQNTKNTILGAGLFLAALGPVTTAVGGAFKAVGSFAGAISNLSLFLKNFGIVQKITTAAQWAWNAAMNANPIGIIIGIIALLVGAFIYLWNTNEDFRNGVIAIWNAVVQAAQQIWGSLLTFFTDLWNGIAGFFTKIWNGIKAYFDTVFKVIKALVSGDFTAVAKIINDIWNGIVRFFAGIFANIGKAFDIAFKKMAGMVGDTMKNIGELVNKVWTALQDGFKNIAQIGRDIVDGIWKGLSNGWNWLVDQAKRIAGDLINSVKKVLGIKSPSTVFAEMGENIGEGLSRGIDSSVSLVSRAMDRLMDATLVSPKIGSVTMGGLALAPDREPDAWVSVNARAGWTEPSMASESSSVTIAPGAIQVTIQGNAEQADVTDAVSRAFTGLVRELRAI